MSDLSAHWSGRYRDNPHDTLSWWRPHLDTSLRLLEEYAPRHDGFVDVGAGASSLAGDLLGRGWTDITLVDIAATALAAVTTELGERPSLHLVCADIRDWQPGRTFSTWHDRAVFHFLTEDDVDRYVALVAASLDDDGVVIMGTFAPGGPTQCSGLPVRQWDAASIATRFAPVGELVHHEPEEHVTPAGATQLFNWFVLRRG
jgi:SAM-dependent methyltransferase